MRSIYGVGRHAIENLVNIMNVNSILVHCNIIHSSYMRGTQATVSYNFLPSMDNVFGDNIGEEGLGNLQVLRKVIAVSGMYVDYINEIQASHKLGYPAYWIASEGSPTLVFTYENTCLGAHHQQLDDLSKVAVTKAHSLAAYWNAASIKGDRGIRDKRGATCEAGPNRSTWPERS